MAREQEIVAYLEQWPDHCQDCRGRGGRSWSDYPHGPAGGFDPCPSCTEKGVCARCGKLGLTSEECGDDSTGAGPCKFCGWDYHDGGCPEPDFPDYPELPEEAW